MAFRIWQKLASTFFIAGTILTIAAGSAYYWIAKIQLEKEIFSKFKSVVSLKKDSLDEFFSGNIEHIKNLQIGLGYKYRLLTLGKYKNDKTNPEYIEAKEFLEKRYNEYTNVNKEFNHLMLTDKTGEIVFVSTPEGQSHLGKLLNEMVPAEESVFDKAKDRVYRTDILYYPDYEDCAMILAAPLFLDEKFIGEVVLEVNIDAILKIVHNRTGLGETGETYFVGEDFLIRSQSRFMKEPTILKTKVDTEGTRAWYEEQIVGGIPPDVPGCPSIYRDYRGVKVLGMHYHIHETNWAMMAEIDTDEAFAPLAVIRNYLIIIICMVPIAAVLLGLFLSRDITEGISQLDKGTKIIGSGNLEYKIDIKTEDEIRDLATSFSQMTKDLKGSRDELVSAKDYTDNIIKSMIDTLIVVDPDGKIKTINPATVELLGYKENELVGRPVATIFAEEVSIFKGTRLKKLIEEGTVRDYDMKCRTKKGEVIPVSFSGAVMRDKEGELVGIVGIARDIREIKRLIEAEKKRADELEKAQDASLNIMEDLDERRKELDTAIKELRETQTKLIQAGKMAAMGTLGASIAHQLNQPLAGIRGFTQTVLMQIDKKNPIYEDLKKIEEQTGYMSEIIVNISGFARVAEFKKAPIDINDPIEKALQLFSEQIRLHGIKLVKNLDPKLPRVNADVNQMQQVFVNFITNSREALDDLPKEAKKELVISSRKTVDSKQKKKFIEVTFKDTGPGIPADIKDRIFEPFFTTKRSRSTGLGLSLNYGMIQNHGGVIEFESKLGKGTTFVVRLPVFKGEKSVGQKEKKT